MAHLRKRLQKSQEIVGRAADFQEKIGHGRAVLHHEKDLARGAVDDFCLGGGGADAGAGHKADVEVGARHAGGEKVQKIALGRAVIGDQIAALGKAEKFEAIGPRAADQRIHPGAAVQRVIALPPVKPVIAEPTLQPVRKRVAIKLVGMIGAAQPLD